MTTPAASPGFLARLRDWFDKDVEPRVAGIEGDVENLKKLGPAVLQLASTVEALVKSADPSAAPEVAALLSDAEKAVAVIAQVVAELAASGV